jgi:AmmeMemoRadiSam system protein A/AmmeMemoRadiSam system protein B
MPNASSIVFSGIAPHPPIMVPEVGHESIAAVHRSIEAMAELTKRLIASGAETVVLISPHAPLDPDAFVAYQGPDLYGDFANFRAPEATVHAPLDEELLNAIAREAEAESYEVVLRGRDLDHGTAVPLYFLQRNGWTGRVVALGYSFLANEDHLRFGECVKRAAENVGRPVAFIASGDLSHRLKPEAPAGYNPTAHLFDEEVVDALRANSPDRIINIDQELRRIAGECGYRSMLVAFGVTSELPLSCEVLNYEAPFGVGYLVAQLTNQKPSARQGNDRQKDSKTETELDEDNGEALPALARRTVETFVLAGTQIKPPENPSGLLAERAACFVSIKTRDGDLRGCIGTIEPVRDTLAEELIANAINAATRDPRFLPVSASELPNLRYSVDILSASEPAKLEELDPAVYGVIVEDESGLRRGLLLPDIEGVDTASKQVEIASRKAGIPPGTPVKLSRFRAQRFREAIV